MFYSVAGHIFELTREASEHPISIGLNFAPFRVDDNAGDVLFRVVLDRPVVPRADEPLTTFDYDLQEGDCTLCIYDDEYRLSLRSRGKQATIVCPRERAEEGPVYTFYADFYTDGKRPNGVIFDHAMVFAYSFATHSYDTLLIHSSVIVKDGLAVMCLGESGTGKSTHTRLWLEYIEGTERLNDDGPVVRVMPNGEVRVFGSPWSGKGCVWKQESYPLGAFLRLRQAPYNQIKRLHKIAAFGALLPSTLPTLQKEERALDHICDALSKMVATKPIFMLECLPDEGAARLSYETIFAAAGYR